MGDSAEFAEAPSQRADLESNEVEFEGVLHWRCLKGVATPQLRGREWIRGTVKGDGSFDAQGYKLEPLHGLLSIGQYKLQMSESGAVIRGSFQGGAGCDDDFFLYRKDEIEAAEWRKERSRDIQICEHGLAAEVRAHNLEASEECKTDVSDQ